jgi:hypothetical protein
VSLSSVLGLLLCTSRASLPVWVETVEPRDDFSAFSAVDLEHVL